MNKAFDNLKLLNIFVLSLNPTYREKEKTQACHENSNSFLTLNHMKRNLF